MIKSVYYYNIAAHCTVFFLLIGIWGFNKENVEGKRGAHWKIVFNIY